MIIPDTRRIFEIAAVIATGCGKFILMDMLELRFVYIVSAILFWFGYIAYRSKQSRGLLRYWGLSDYGFKKSLRELFPAVVVLILLFVITGNYLGTNILDWSILPILLLYPFWGIIQQFVLIGLFARNLKDIKRIHLSEWVIVLITAIIFSSVHYPSGLMMTGTFLLALIYTKLYLNGRNLIVLGIFHGWLGAFFYYSILGRNSWNEVFGMITSAG